MTTFTITSGISTVDGTAAPYNTHAPGDIFEIAAGSRGALTFQHLTGSVASPLVIRVVGGGSVTITSGGASTLTFSDCRYIDVDGDDDAKGINVTGSSTHGVRVYNNTCDIELHGIHVDGSAGMRGGLTTVSRTTDPDYSIDPLINFTLHHCEIEHVEEPGVYCGKITGGNGVEWNGVSVHDCWVHDINVDGIQTQHCVNVSIYDNVVEDFGLVPEEAQPEGGIVIGNESETLEIYGNVVRRGAQGIRCDGQTGTFNIHNNLVVSMTATGINIATSGYAGSKIQWNTVVSCVSGITTKSGDTCNGDVQSNIVAGASGTALSSSYVDVDHNITGTIAYCDFAETTTYTLAATSPAINAAHDGSDAGWIQSGAGASASQSPSSSPSSSESPSQSPSSSVSASASSSVSPSPSAGFDFIVEDVEVLLVTVESESPSPSPSASQSPSTSPSPSGSASQSPSSSNSPSGSASQSPSSSVSPSSALVTAAVWDRPGTAHTQEFAIGDILMVQSIDTIGVLRQTWMEVDGATDQTTYWNYDLAHLSGDTGVTYPQGSTLVNFGASGEGVVRNVTGGTYPSYVEALTHAGAPWTTVTAHAVLGNLRGFTGVDEWGIATGADLTTLTGDYVVLSESRAYFNQDIEIATGHGIQHADGGTAGWVLVDDGTGLYTPGATGLNALTATEGALIYGNSDPAWAVLGHPAAASRFLQTTNTSVQWLENPQFSEFLYHAGDLNTYLRFQPDQITLVAGGVDMVDVIEGAIDYVSIGAGLLFLNETSNANMVQGITINQGANDGQILALKSSDVAHGLTIQVETDTYGYMSKYTGLSGGLMFTGASELGTHAVRLRAFAGTTPDDTKSAAGYGIMTFGTWEPNGAGDVQAVATADANLFSWDTSGATKMILDVDGEIHTDDVIGVGDDWDDWDDLALAADLSRLPQAKWREMMRYRAEDFERAGLLTLSVDDQGRRHAFIRHKALLQFYACCFREVGERLERYERALIGLGTDPVLLS